MATREMIEKNLAMLEDWDKDNRYMAANDLCNELQKDVKLDSTMEMRICTAILKRLDDKSNDVQSKAIQCLGILLKKVQQGQVFEICDKLCSLILEGNPELRDIYAIGLKTLVVDVPEESGRGVAQRLVGRLLNGIANGEVDIKQECLDCLTDLLKRFGHEVAAEHDAVTKVLLRQLSHEKKSVQKKTTTCLSFAAVVLSDGLLNGLVDNLLSQIGSAKDVRVLIQVVGQISRSVGYRMGKHLNAIVPIFLQFLGDKDDEAQQTELHSELRETIFQGFESFVLRCPREIQPHLPAIMQAALNFMTYDPNYVGDDSEEEEEEEEWEDEEGFEDDGLEDEDDDTSWKVRRAAIKVLGAVMSSRPELLAESYSTYAGAVVARFREREENVRLNVLECFTGLVQTTALAAGRAEGEGGDALGMLRELLPDVITASLRQLGGKEDKTKSAVFHLLMVLCTTVSGAMEGHLDKLIGTVKKCLGDKNHSLKLDALVFLRLAVEHHDPLIIQPFVADLLPLVLDLVKEEWYKIIAEALRVVTVFVKVLRPMDSESGMFMSGDFDFTPFVAPVYSAINPRLEAHDIDQEIKECAITAVGQLVASCSDNLRAETPTILSLLMLRLKNDITRLPALKTLITICQSPLEVDLSPILTEGVTELAHFLRQQSRSLKQTTLKTLMAVVVANAPQMEDDMFRLILQEAAPLISEQDLHLTHLSLRLTVATLQASPKVSGSMSDLLLERSLVLAGSPLLQGRALQSLLALLQEFVKLNSPGTTFDDLYSKLRDSLTEGSQRQAIANVAHCLAALCVHASEAKRASTFDDLLASLTGSDETRKHLALLTVGEMGQHSDLAAIPNLQDIILASFDSSSEETKTAAAFALGRTAVGNMGALLPMILSSLAQEKNHYLLLSSLKEAISLHAASDELDFTPYLDQVLAPLIQHCESPEEGVRNMVAECFGALLTMHPDVILGQLGSLSQNPAQTLMRWTVISSLRYSMTGNTPTAALSSHMEVFLAMLRDEDLGVRLAVLQMCNAAVHHQPSLIQPLLASLVVPVLFETVLLKIERTVDLGPFKQKVDDGLPLRKSALGCINTILDQLPEQLDIIAFMDPLKTGLGDQQDVQILCHQILIKICGHPMMKAAVLSSLDGLVDPLKVLVDKTLKSIMKKMKEGQVGTEVERQNDLLRSCLRAFFAVDAITSEDAGASPKFKQLKDQIAANERLRSMVDAIKAEG